MAFGNQYFHSSPSTNRASILQHGLLVGKDQGSEFPEWEHHNLPPGIFFVRYPDAANPDGASDDIWAADLSGYEVLDDPWANAVLPPEKAPLYKQQQGGSYYVTQDVPASRLQLVRPAVGQSWDDSDYYEKDKFRDDW